MSFDLVTSICPAANYTYSIGILEEKREEINALSIGHIHTHCQLDTFIQFVSDFSLTNWMRNKGLNPADNLEMSYVSRLMHDLGMADLLNENSCSRSASKYDGANAYNWVDGKSAVYMKK